MYAFTYADFFSLLRVIMSAYLSRFLSGYFFHFEHEPFSLVWPLSRCNGYLYSLSSERPIKRPKLLPHCDVLSFFKSAAFFYFCSKPYFPFWLNCRGKWRYKGWLVLPRIWTKYIVRVFCWLFKNPDFSRLLLNLGQGLASTHLR